MKRFYKLVSVAQADAGRYTIQLDGKPVKTPSGAVMHVPGEALANAIMREWMAQEKEIIPENMPLTQILVTARDRVALERKAMEKATLGYLNTDMLCYRTSLPAAVAQRQENSWDPWLLWFKSRYKEQLQTTTDLRSLTQPATAHTALATEIAALNDLDFTVLQIVTSLSGSLVLGLAFLHGAATPDDVYATMHVEEFFKAEVYNEEKYGPAPHEDRKRKAALRDLQAAHEFLKATGTL